MISVKQVFLVGEGKTELGSWANEPERQDDSSPGILKTLLRKVKETGWEIKAARRWKSVGKDSKVKPIRRYRTGIHLKPEEQTIRGACLLAKEKGCEIIAFSRDIDGDSDYNKNRKRDIESGILKVSEDYPEIKIIGGCARPTIEGWILAFAGVRGTETYSKDKANEKLAVKLSEQGFPSQSTQVLVEFMQSYNRADVAEDAICLIQWLDSAEKILKLHK
jgi:hypothetical protein